MKCPYCEAKEPIEHMVITKDAKGHIHVHGPLNNHNLMMQMIKAIVDQTKKYSLQSIQAFKTEVNEYTKLMQASFNQKGGSA